MRRLNQVPGYESLAPDQQALFAQVYEKHMDALGNQAKQVLGLPVSVVWHAEDECLHVHYKTIWFQYAEDGTWY